MQYSYLYNIPPLGGNNGRICSSLDSFAGERVPFALANANSGQNAGCLPAGNSSTWSQSFLNVGFGNLTGKYSSGSPVPFLRVSVDPNTNHIISSPYGYDSNGNMTTGPNGVLLAYDVENRLTSAMPCTGCSGSMYYTYDAQNRRIGSWGAQQNGIQNYTIYFYGVEGHLLGTYQASIATGNTPTLTVSTLSTQPYFGGRRLSALDRIGSDRSNGKSFYPYGEDKGTPGPNDTWKFATYWRDSVSGLDYAMNRYYSSALGRFMSPDRTRRSAEIRSPNSWNRYAYANDDPVNNNDPSGKTCIAQDRKWKDDGTGCSYAGTEVSDWGRVNQGADGTPEVSTSVSFPSCMEPCGDVAIDPYGAAILTATGQMLSSVSVGFFVYGGDSTPSNGAKIGKTGVWQCDTNSGCSTSSLSDLTIGNVTVATETSADGSSFDKLMFIDIIPDLYGTVMSTQSGTFGYYLGTGNFGLGLYFSLGGSTSAPGQFGPSVTGGGSGGPGQARPDEAIEE